MLHGGCDVLHRFRKMLNRRCGLLHGRFVMLHCGGRLFDRRCVLQQRVCQLFYRCRYMQHCCGEVQHRSSQLLDGGSRLSPPRAETLSASRLQ